MIDAVIGRDIRDGERVNTLKAPDVVTIFVGIGAALMMCIDPAIGAEVVLGCERVESVET